MYELRRKSIGNKRNDITDACRDIIVKAYGEFQDKTYTFGNKTCESKIFENVEFGYNRITIESPLFDENGKPVMNGKKECLILQREIQKMYLLQKILMYILKEK